MDTVSGLRKIVLSGFAAIVLGLVLSSCGEGSGATAAKPLTRAQFIKRANAICEKQEGQKYRRLEARLKPGVGLFEVSPAELETLFSTVVLPLYDELLSEMESLTPPPEDEAKIEEVFDKYRATLKSTESNPRQLLRRNPFIATDEVAARYGLQKCTF